MGSTLKMDFRCKKTEKELAVFRQKELQKEDTSYRFIFRGSPLPENDTEKAPVSEEVAISVRQYLSELESYTKSKSYNEFLKELK